MINLNFFRILIISDFVIRILRIFIIFALIAIVGVITAQKKLEPNCNKDFSILFRVFLVFLFFSLIINNFFFEWKNSLAYILLSFSMEIYLFHKKSKWKFSILATILLCGSIILWITNFVLNFFLQHDNFAMNIINMVIVVLTSFNYVIIGIVILNLLRKTARENLSLKTYTKPISIGIFFIFIIKSLITLIIAITIFINDIDSFNNNEIYFSILLGTSIYSELFFIIGIIILAIGAIKTMSVPLIFSRDEGIKGILPKNLLEGVLR